MPSDRLLQLAVFSSGDGRYLQPLLTESARRIMGGRVAIVFGEQEGGPAFEKADEFHVPYQVLDRGHPPSIEAAVNYLEHYQVDAALLDEYPLPFPSRILDVLDGWVLGIHPSLNLGRYGLLEWSETHEAVLRSREPWSGCTIFFVSDGTKGGSILLRGRVPVLAGDAPETLARRVQAQAFYLLPAAVGIVRNLREEGVVIRR